MKSIIYNILILFICFIPCNIQAFDRSSTKSIGLAGAVTANPPGLMAIHHNPAGLYQAREGLVYHQSLQSMTLNRKNRFYPEPSFEILNLKAVQDSVANQNSGSGKTCLYYPFYGDAHGDLLILPLPVGTTYRSSKSRWIMAMGSYMPFFQGIQFAPDDASQYQTQQYYRQHLVYASPAIAYQWCASFSIGMSLGMGQTALGQNNKLRILNDRFAKSKFLPPVPDVGPFDGLADIQMELRDDMAMSFNLGFLWKPIKRLTLGFVYRSAITTTPKGQMDIHFSDAFMALTQYCRDNPYFSRQLDSSGLEKIRHQKTSNAVALEKFEWPDTIQMGAKYAFSNDIHMMFDMQWTRWSSQKSYRLVLNSENPLIPLLDALDQSSGQVIHYHNEMKDTLSYHLALEWQFKESVKIRNGISYHPQSVSDSQMNLMYLPDIFYIGTGFEWRWPNRWVIEQGLGYYVSNTKQIENSKQLNHWDLKQSFFLPYAGQIVSSKVSGIVISLSVNVPLI